MTPRRRVPRAIHIAWLMLAVVGLSISIACDPEYGLGYHPVWRDGFSGPVWGWLCLAAVLLWNTLSAFGRLQ